MDYYQLHCFKLAAEYQSITQAAQVLHVSQPSLSQTIQRLEKELGYPLFERYHKKIKLNASGELLYRRACQMEQFMSDTRLELDEMNQRCKPIVRLYVSCASMLLPKLLHFLMETYPAIEFQVFQWNDANRDKNDGLWLLSEPISGQDTVLLEESFALALPADHPLVQKEQIWLSDLVDEKFIQLTDQWALKNLVSDEWHMRGFAPHVIMQFDNPALMREILKNQMGIAFIPSITWNLTADQKVVMREVKDCTFSRKIYLHIPEGYNTKEQKLCAMEISAFFRQLSQMRIG